MQRYYSEKRDVHGRVEPYATVSVFESGTDTLATIYNPSDSSDTPSSPISNPLQTDANGRYGFAAPNGDYDIVCQGSGSQEYRVRVNLFDSTTSSTAGAGGNDAEVQYNSGGVLTGASGLTTDGASLTARSINFNTSSPVTTLVQGNTYWDDTNETLSTVLDATNNVILQHGQEVHIACANKTGVIIPNGKAVYINDAQGNRPTCALAKADALATCQVVGVTTQPIGINATGLVTVLGKVNDFNTFGFSADGVTLYLSAATAGELTETAPSSPNYVVRVGLALNTTPSGAIFVNPNRSLAADTTMAANTNTVPPTQKAVKAYADGVLTTAEAYTDTLRSDLSSTSDLTKGDALVGVKSALTGAVATTQREVNSRAVSLLDFDPTTDRTGSVDVTGVFSLAAASGATHIRVPAGTYKISGNSVIRVRSGQTWDFDNVILNWTNSGSQVCVYTPDTNDWRIRGSLTIDGQTVTPVTGSMAAVYMAGGQRWLMENVTVRNCSGHGFWLDAGGSATSPRGDQGRALNCAAYNCWIGLEITGNSGTEFTQWESFQASGCLSYGIIDGTGNTTFINPIVVDNAQGFWVSGAGYANSAHGTVLGGHFTHNTGDNFLATNVILGYSIIGTRIYGDSAATGTIHLTSCEGVSFEGCTIDAAWIMDGTSSRNTVSNCYFDSGSAHGTTYANTLTGSQATQLYFQGNWTLYGPSIMNDVAWCYCSAKANSQALTSGVLAQVTFADELSDLRGNLNGATGAFTAPLAGLYRIIFNGVFVGGTVPTGYVQLNKNGTAMTYQGISPMDAGTACSSLSADLILAAGDVITISAKITCTTPFVNGATYVSFQGMEARTS